MTEIKVSSITTTQVNAQPNKSPKKEKKSKFNATNVTLYGLGALGVIGAAILAVRHGKTGKALQEIGIDNFKEAGNFFKKGNAFTKEGKPFTGTVTKENAAGFKHHIQYENGVIKEVKKTRIIKFPDGRVGELPCSKKSYTYNAEGKLESVDKFDWVHVNTNNPKNHGFQYIKSSSTNLDKKRSEGLKNFAEKQEKKKQEEINQYVNDIEEKLSDKTEISADGIDKSFNNDTNNDLSYCRLTDNIKENVSKIKEKLHTKTEISAEKIDKQFETKNPELDKLNEYYKGLEEKAEAEARRLAEKQAKKAEWEKFVKEHPEEAAQIKAEKKAAKKAATKAKKEEILSQNTKIARNIYGQKVKAITIDNKDGSQIIKHYTPDGKTLLHEFYVDALGRETHFAYSGNSRTTVVNKGQTLTIKLSEKNESVKYVEIKRETTDLHTYEKKVVERLKNGNTKITVSDETGKVVIIRDKKGKILSKERFNSSYPEPPGQSGGKLLAAWYTEYLKLCRQFGVQPRIVGIKGGAWDHFYELNLRATDPEAYESYLRLRAYRARYDDTARIMQGLDNGVLDPASLEYVKQTQSFESLLEQLNYLDNQQDLQQIQRIMI